MKRLNFILLVTFLLSISYGYSQANNPDSATTKKPATSTTANDFRPFRIGVYGDLGVSWMDPKSERYTKNGSRLVAGWGLVFDLNFTENYTFSSGFSLGGYGGSLEYKHMLTDSTVGIMDRKYKIKYIDIPLNLKLKTNQIGYFTYFFQIGLNNSFRLSATSDDVFTTVQSSGGSYARKDVDIVGSTSLYRLSFNVGAGAEYQISKSFSAFAIIGFNNGLLNSLSGQNTFDPAIKENAIINRVSLTAGFLF